MAGRLPLRSQVDHPKLHHLKHTRSARIAEGVATHGKHDKRDPSSGRSRLRRRGHHPHPRGPPACDHEGDRLHRVRRRLLHKDVAHFGAHGCGHRGPPGVLRGHSGPRPCCRPAPAVAAPALAKPEWVGVYASSSAGGFVPPVRGFDLHRSVGLSFLSRVTGA